MGGASHNSESHRKHGDPHLNVTEISAQMHARQAQPHPTGTSAGSETAKAIASLVTGKGVDWWPTVDGNPPDHGTFRVTLAYTTLLILGYLTYLRIKGNAPPIGDPTSGLREMQFG